jgi:CcmD family protein
VTRPFQILLVWVALAVVPSVSLANARQQQPPADFVPVENAPPGEQIPAMPLLGAAYGFIWIGVFGYVWSLSRRLQKVESELAALESRQR